MYGYIWGMKLNTVIFDMDGLLIDSEPLWKRAAEELFEGMGIRLTPQDYAKTTGLRTKEFLQHWFIHFSIGSTRLDEAETRIVNRVVDLVKEYGRPMPGVHHIFSFFKTQDFNIGLATSSGPALIEVVIELLGIKSELKAISSAEGLAYGKPHPEVYLNCAGKLGVQPRQCICFEDSYNGMIAAKAAGMKCVVVPEASNQQKPVWEAADLKIPSLENFSSTHLKNLTHQ